jgi:hypothetical protein
MELESILIILALGAAVGWLAGLIVKGGGFGLIVNTMSARRSEPTRPKISTTLRSPS